MLCAGECPWELVDPWAQEVLEIVLLSATASGKDDELTFYFDVRRFEVACRIFQVPQEEWREALQWVRFALAVCNDREGRFE
jgi:hypothetical protein